MNINYIEGNIREYDISSANVSILVEHDFISEELYTDLMEGDKQFRNILVGKLIRKHPEVYEILKTNIDKSVDKFISVNKLSKDNILEISKDAIFTINVKKTKERDVKTKFGEYITFVAKHDYLTLLEFNPKDTSEMLVKFYLCRDDNEVECRYGNLDNTNPLYEYIVDMMRFKYNHKKIEFNQTLRSFIASVNRNSYDDVCSTVKNERLVEVFREFASL